ncbi:hypothetical protein EC844_12140 [Acinetobacter calcoaceticus]|uniref:Uncharacterized protein n=1 Tax=Acinetobacter calcoaceticus TaxID=471 RepID=A0A4R1XN90_ACICA|nr:hypothetical protein EC844_12140 [Acinetobacter calcoaceticus]
MRPLSPPEREQVLTFIEKSQKILAIKYIRNLFNYGVSEAKRDVEQLMLDPEFEPAMAILDTSAGTDHYYKGIELDRHTQQIFIVAQDGEKSLIDQQHPGWHTIMMLLTQRQFSNEQDYLNQMRLIRNAEDLSLMQQEHHKQQTIKATQQQNYLFQVLQAQDKKNNLIIASSTVVIVVMCIMFVLSAH